MTIPLSTCAIVEGMEDVEVMTGSDQATVLDTKQASPVVVGLVFILVDEGRSHFLLILTASPMILSVFTPI